MTFIINNIWWIAFPILIFLSFIGLSCMVRIVGEEKARAYRPPLTFEEFCKRNNNNIK